MEVAARSAAAGEALVTILRTQAASVDRPPPPPPPPPTDRSLGTTTTHRSGTRSSSLERARNIMLKLSVRSGFVHYNLVDSFAIVCSSAGEAGPKVCSGASTRFFRVSRMSDLLESAAVRHTYFGGRSGRIFCGAFVPGRVACACLLMRMAGLRKRLGV